MRRRVDDTVLARISPYEGQPLVLTTHHGKERALERVFRMGLGMTLQVCDADTDALGTFSGDIERTANAIDTCRRKAELGLEASGLSLGVASEASFGPHPGLPLLAVGQEVLLFIDRQRKLEVVEQRLEWTTNYSQLQLEPDQEPDGWLRQVGFPSHGIIARPLQEQEGLLYEGLRRSGDLRDAIELCRQADPQGRVWLETDMRAHCNPTRMRSIRRLGVALARRLQSHCPQCQSPGWGLIATEPGLPCSSCGTPTTLTQQEIWGCPLCSARRRQPRRDGQQTADPGQCPWCNP
jgi:hypothetical protein